MRAMIRLALRTGLVLAIAVDQLDLDNDGMDEVVVRSEFYEAWNYAVWRFDSNYWGQIFEGGGGGC
jgi:hypothetical protein